MKDFRNDFPFFEFNKDLVYLDNAASSLKLGAVIDKTSTYYKTNGANVHRGVYRLQHDATIMYEETRSLVAKLINSDVNEVIFTKGTTDSLNSLAISLKDFINPGDEIITSELEHHSSILPWMQLAKVKGAKLVYVPLTEEGKITLDNFNKVLTNKTKVVALTHASNALGFKTPIVEITKSVCLNNKETIVILDTAQSISHIKVDVKAFDVDFIAFSAHKIYGPSGVGVLYGKEAWLEKLPPFDFGGEMAEIVDKDKFTYKEAPYKFEAGTPNVAGVIGFSEAVKFLLENDLKELSNYTESLRLYALEQLKLMDSVEIYNVNSDSPMITFNVENIHPHDIASVLDQKGIALRAGHHCAQLVNKRLKQISTLRVSFQIYNTKAEIDKFIIALKETISFFEEFGV